MTAWKSILKPDASTMAGIATVAAVAGVYQLSLGPISQAQATDPNHPVLESSRKKAGVSSLVLVSGLFLITKDFNLAILGGATIVVLELIYRHGIMADPMSGRMQNPAPQTAFEPAENVIPMYAQGETA